MAAALAAALVLWTVAAVCFVRVVADDAAISSAIWTEIEPQHDNNQPSLPRTRYSHSATLVNNEMVITHGYFYDHSGRGPQWLDDTFAYSLTAGMVKRAQGRWREVNPGSRKNRVAPHPRMSHSAVFHEGKFLLFGGDDGGHRNRGQQGYRGTYLSDLWELDTGTGAWHELRPANADTAWPVAGYAHHAAVGIDGSMVIYGGLRRDELWRFWIHTHTWERIEPVAGSLPGKRHGCGVAAHPNGGGFFLFGGYRFQDDSSADNNDKIGPIDDLWYFSMVDRKWMLLQPSHPAGGRTYASMVVTQNHGKSSLMLFAGANCKGSCECFGDVWTYPIDGSDGSDGSDGWSEVAVNEEPITRYKQATIIYGSSIYTFGGESYKPYMYHNSVIRLSWGQALAQSEENIDYSDPQSTLLVVVVIAVVLLGFVAFCSCRNVDGVNRKLH